MKKEKKGLIASRPNYSVAIKYSRKSISDGLIKFIPKEGRPFEIQLGDLINMLAKHVNSDVLAPAMMHNSVVRMIQVRRNLTFTPNRDIKEGETVNIPFSHMMPIEFAIAEEALGLAAIDESVKTLNLKELREASLRVSEEVTKFSEEQNKGLLAKLNKETGTDREGT